ncbi:hypothetical protein ACHAWT_002345 [Skeletonema menzelii]
MTDETTPTASPAAEPVVEDASPPENDANGAAASGQKKDNKGEKEQVPIEELYDLSKPIKRIERPSKDEQNAAIAAIDEEIDALREERNVVQKKIDESMGKQKNTPIGRERDALNKLKNRKGLMIEQKRQIRARLEIVKMKADQLIGQQKNARSTMKFTNLADIEKEINRLQRKQETSSMSLSDEKKLIKDIEALQASKRTAEELKSKQGDLDTIKDDRKAIQGDLNAKDKEIDSIQKEIDAQSKVLKDLVDKQSSQRGTVDELVKQRDALKGKIDDKFKEKNTLRTEFREKTNDWYHNQRAIKAQRQMQYEEEKKRREEEKAAWLKKKEEEELAKTPYEEEMALCDYLAEYLTKTYLTGFQDEEAKKAKEAEEKAKADVVAVKDDPFAGFKAVSKKAEDDVNYFGKGKGKKKLKAKKANKAPTFSLSLDLFDQFGLITLNPPTSLDGVAASVEELKAKKQWYSEQPRGSVPTARDIRKANAEASAKAQTKGVKAENKGKKGNFSISNEEFAPLGTGAVSTGTGENWIS